MAVAGDDNMKATDIATMLRTVASHITAQRKVSSSMLTP